MFRVGDRRANAVGWLLLGFTAPVVVLDLIWADNDFVLIALPLMITLYSAHLRRIERIVHTTEWQRYVETYRAVEGRDPEW